MKTYLLNLVGIFIIQYVFKAQKIICVKACKHIIIFKMLSM